MAEIVSSAASGDEIVNDLPVAVLALLSEEAKVSGLHTLIAHLLLACKTIGTNLRNCSYSSDQIGNENAFGDSQLDVDIKSDEVIFQLLRTSKLVATASSEEVPTSQPCGGKGFSVAFDPLDGSSIVDANFAVGTIMGVWPGDALLHRTGREQCCALLAQYGPRITALLAISPQCTATGQAACLELSCKPSHWCVSIPSISIAAKAKIFAPGNLRATSDNPRYKALVDYWIDNRYTLRYSGGLVPDVYHIFIKGNGVLSNASSPNAKAKLRLLYECAPIALIIESAGGASCVSASEAAEATDPISVLDVPISNLDKRIGVCFGSTEEVDRFKGFIFN